MMFRAGSRVWLKKALIAAALLAVTATARQARADLKDAGPAALKQHLINLEAVAQACRTARNTKACDQSLVGSDDRLQWTAGAVKESREIRYDWLRDLLDRAGKKENTAKEPAAPQSTSILPQVTVIQQKPATLDELLGAAIDRLKDEQAQIDPLTASQAANDFAGKHKKLMEILSRRAYKEVAESTARNRFWEWLDNLINRLVGKLAGFGGKAWWLPWLLMGLLILGVLIGLVWSLIQIERRSRIRLIPDTDGMAGAPSAREWQLWLKDAQDAAAGGLWREAIHFLYWAAISRLESKRLWPADRARTPREYLLLLPTADPRRDNLTTLTRSFERTWYGGREAALTDYEAARTLAAGLGVE
jgi:cell pole-organizing protein PopZ